MILNSSKLSLLWSSESFSLSRFCGFLLLLRSESVFVGETKFDTFRDTLYAISSYVDDNTPTIKRNAMNLLEGPTKSKAPQVPADRYKRSDKRNYIIFGHYEKPTSEQMFDTITGKDSDQQLSVPPSNTLWYIGDESEQSSKDDEKIIIPDTNSIKNNVSVVKDDELSESKARNGLLKTLTIKFKYWFDNEDNKILKLLMVILIGMVITMFWYFHTTVRELRQQSQDGSKTKIPRSTDSNGSYGVDQLNGGE